MINDWVIGDRVITCDEIMDIQDNLSIHSLDKKGSYKLDYHIFHIFHQQSYYHY